LSHVVLGLGLSSKATRGEVRDLVEGVILRGDIPIEGVRLVATRMRFVDDERVRVGPPIIGVEDATLLDRFPVSGRVGFAARVAEGCALIGAGIDAELLVSTTRSTHATAALAIGSMERGDS
jgi:hypothetical protein